MAITQENKVEVISKYGKDSKDTGSTEVQIALLTARIENLSEHMKNNKKDYHSLRGLLQMVGKRKRLLSYLERNNYEGYKELIKNLGLRR